MNLHMVKGDNFMESKFEDTLAILFHLLSCGFQRVVQLLLLGYLVLRVCKIWFLIQVLSWAIKLKFENLREH